MDTTQANTATYAKLRDGSWGVRTTGCERLAGDVVTVTKRSGEAKTETLGSLVWSGDGVSLWRIAARAISTRSISTRSSDARRGTWTGCPCGSIEEYSRPSDCWTCQHEAE